MLHTLWKDVVGAATSIAPVVSRSHGTWVDKGVYADAKM